MVRKKTQEEFISQCREIHEDKYDYSETVYVNDRSKITVKCLSCDLTFEQTANCHVKGRGCPDCGILKKAQSKSLTKAEFISRANEAHGEGKYDYSHSEIMGVKKVV